MQITDIEIRRIVDVGGRPSHALGTAAFADGHRHDFTVMFAHRYNDSRVFVSHHPETGPQHPGSPAARAIHDRLNLGPIARLERDAMAAFEQDRAAACRALMRDRPA